ncbi:Cytochrome P450 CYP82J17 [Linum perenne]
MSSSLQHYVLNIITRMVAGKRYFNEKSGGGGGRPIGQVMKEFMLVTGTLVPSDLIPVLGWFGFQGVVKDMKRVSKELDVIMESWVEDHKKKEIVNGGRIDSDSDLIDVMLHEIKDDVAYGHKRETIVKATAMSLIVAGSDTTSITLSWILSNLLNHKQVLKLAQQEIDDKVGTDRWVDDSDIENLAYLGAVIKETLRMYPPGPLSVPREASEDITIKGYHVPKGTRFFANFWKLHRDPKVWSNPDEYKPERFLTDNASLEIFGQQFEYLPFGSGRRGCPGINFGMQVTKLTLARLLQGFDWDTPEGKPVDMTEGMGIALPKANPLEVVLTPRLDSQLY